MDQPPVESPWLDKYLFDLRSRSPKTLDAYQRALRQFLGWLMTLPGNAEPFAPQYLTRTARLPPTARQHSLWMVTIFH